MWIFDEINIQKDQNADCSVLKYIYVENLNLK